MNNRNNKSAKILIIIPIIILLITLSCLGLSSVLASSTNKGTVYTVLMLIGLMNLVLAPFPCLIMSVLGTIFASKALKEGIKESRILLVIGIIEIIVFILGVILAAVLLLIGQGV